MLRGSAKYGGGVAGPPRADFVASKPSGGDTFGILRHRDTRSDVAMTPITSHDLLPELSVVVPVLDEAENVEALVAEVEAAMTSAQVVAELIVVDDGSRDETLPRLLHCRTACAWLRVLHRSVPEGQSSAMHAGIAAARAPYTATLDGDLQNDPADLPRLLEIVRSGEADMAQGHRSRRRDTLVRKASSWVGRSARRLLLGDRITDTGCSTRVMKTQLARQFPLQYQGMHRFLPIYARMLGVRVVEVPVSHRRRHAGATKYGIGNRALAGLIDCFAVRWMGRRLRGVATDEQE